MPVTPEPQGDQKDAKTSAGRVIGKVLKAVALVAGITFFIFPFTDSGRWAMFLFACLFIAIILGVLGAWLDDQHIGFWPDKPSK